MLSPTFWICLPLVAAWQAELPEDLFLQQARQEIGSFHNALFSLAHFPLATQIQEEYSKPGVKSKNSRSAEGGGAHQQEKTSHGSKHGSSSHDNESGKKGHSTVDKELKKYGEEFRKKGDEYFADGDEKAHHSSSEGGTSGRFKDRLLHKKGNYEKGYRDRYHLDEVLKQDKFWSDRHTVDQFHRYGHKNSGHHKKHHGKFKHDNKEAGKHSEDHGKKGESAGGHKESEHKGHKKEGGAKSNYAHKEEYAKKNKK